MPHPAIHDFESFESEVDVIPRHIFTFRAYDDGDNERRAVERIGGNHQHGPLPGLLAALHGVQVDELNFATLIRLSSRCIFGSAAIAERSASQVSRQRDTATRTRCTRRSRRLS